MKKNILFLFAVLCVIQFTNAQIKIDIDIRTGEDNLEPKDFMNNPSIVLYIKGLPEIVVENINKKQKWPSNSSRRVSIQVPSRYTLNDITHIEIRRKDSDGNHSASEELSADNWDIKRLLVFASFKENSRNVKYQLLNLGGTSTFLHFVYNNKIQSSMYTDSSKKYEFRTIDRLLVSGAPPSNPANPGLVLTKPVKLTVTISTGGDDLRGGNDKANIKIYLKNKPSPIIWNNIFLGKKLDNFTTTIAIKTMEKITNLDDIEKIELWHSGGGGAGADNWDIDKVLIVAAIDDSRKLLVDQAGVPLHRFTGDTRRKTFIVE